MRVLVTGAAGFIGFHLTKKLLQLGHEVTGIDNMCPYYDPKLKEDRIKNIESMPEAQNFKFQVLDLADGSSLADLFNEGAISHVVNLAAQAGVRYSLKNPGQYINSNLVGFGNLLECCRHNPVEHLIFASSSSVYGLDARRPYSEHQNVDHPVSLYAATKKSNEMMAHAYSHLYKIPSTGLRFFTVYGAWGRPDMALDIFTKAILQDEPIKIFNNGQMQRDFTYIDDIIEGVYRVMLKPAQPNPAFDPVHPDPASSSAPYRVYNIGNNHTVALSEFIATLEDALGKKAIREYLPMQPGDVESTWADVSDLQKDFNYKPDTPLAKGISVFVKWYKNYYGYA